MEHNLRGTCSPWCRWLCEAQTSRVFTRDSGNLPSKKQYSCIIALCLL